MAVKFLAAGGDEDFGIGIFDGTDGTPVPTASSVQVHGGHKRSITFDHTNANTSDVRANASVADSGGRISVWVYFATMSGAASNGLIQLAQSGSVNTTANVRISNTGVLTINAGSSGTQIGGNGATLSTGIWYRLTFCWTITSTTVNSFKLYVNGLLSASGSNVTLTNVASADARFGNCSGDTSEVLYMSDFYIDNDTSLNDTGEIWVTAKRPFANGTANGFTTQIGAGGSGYGSGHAPQVNERANSDTNGWSISTAAIKTEEYNIETKATGDIDISTATIVDYMGWIRASEASTANSPVTHIIVNGVATAKTLTTAAAFYKQIAGSATYPAGTGTDIGMDGQYTTTAHLYSLFECGVTVAYIPSVAAAPASPPMLARITSKFVGPQALRNSFVTPNYPDIPTPIPPYPDVPMGMNVGNDQLSGTAWNAAENDTDLQVITGKLRQKRVRIALATYSDAAGISNMRQMALNYKANGYFVSYGVTGNGATQNATTYAAWKAQVPTEAAWASANKINRFYIGNEEDWQAQIGAFGTITDATVRTDVLALAATLKASYPNMEIVYSTAQGTVTQWNAAGTGSLDKLGFNMYDTQGNFAPNIAFFMSQIGAKYFVSEWASNFGYWDMIHNFGYTDIQYANDIASRFATLVANGLEAYFFAYRYGDNTVGSGNYNIIDNNNVPVPGYEQAFGAPALPYPQVAPTLVANRFVGPMAMRFNLRRASFTVSVPAAAITQTIQNILGVARIQIATLKTITGIARITVITTKTLQGLSRITVSALKTIQGVARITATTTQTLLGKARITATTNQTILGKSRITVTTNQTLLGKARVTATTLQTLLGKARITATTLKTLLGKARITNTSVQTILGKSRIQITTLQTITGKARITATTLQTLLAKARITATSIQTLLGKARIQNTTLQTITGKARLSIISLQTLLGKARITVTVGGNLLFNGDFEIIPSPNTAPTNTSGKWIDGTAAGSTTTSYGWAIPGSGLGASASATFDTSVSHSGNASLRLSTANTSGTVVASTFRNNPPSVANLLAGEGFQIQPSTSYTITGWVKTNNVATNAVFVDFRRFSAAGAQLGTTSSLKLSGTNDWTKFVITVTVESTAAYGTVLLRNGVAGNISDAWFDDIQVLGPNSLLGLARITNTTQQTILGVSRITVTTLRTLTGLARLSIGTNKTITGIARVTNTTPQTILGRARITATTTQTMLGRSRITVTTTKTLLGKAQILVTTLRTLTGRARITAVTLRTLLGKARITATSVQLILGHSRITVTSQQQLPGKARLQVTSTQQTHGLAKISVMAQKSITGKARILVPLGPIHVRTVELKAHEGTVRLQPRDTNNVVLHAAEPQRVYVNQE